MHELELQVRRARRRLTVERFLRAAVWCLTVGLSLALGLVLLDKFRPLGLDPRIWPVAGAGMGCLVALVWALARRATAVDAACEIDRRFGLRERVSSVLLLSEADRQSPAGQALAADAAQRVARVEVPEMFRVSVPRWSWLPLVPAAGVLIVATMLQPSQPARASVQLRPAGEQVKKSTDKLREKLAERRKQLDRAGLKDAEELVTKLEQGTAELSKQNELDRKQTLVKLNNLAQDLARRREQLGGAERLRQQLNQMRGFERGPADRLSQAMRQGDYRQALRELDKLKEQLEKGQLDEASKSQLAKQVEQLAEKLNQLAEAEKKQRQELEQAIAQKRSEGKNDEADDLQKQLERLSERQRQAGQFEKMASQLSEMKKSLEQGKTAEATAQLDAMRTEMANLAQQLEELEMLEGALDELAEAKESMACSECEGEGCAACRGRAHRMGQGRGTGEGRGEGDRPEERTDTGQYDTRVRQKLGRGASVVTGLVEGPNVKGQVQAEIAAEFEAAQASPTDPLTDQPLPADVREHARSYFESLRRGE